jgi:hypothetical protein
MKTFKMIIGSKYKITEPNYDEDLYQADIVEVISKNTNGYILKNIEHNFTYERTYSHLKTCKIELI